MNTVYTSVRAEIRVRKVASGTMDKLELYQDEILKLVPEAGKVVVEGFTSVKEINTKKGPWDVVTEYDVKVEKMLMGRLKETFPTHKFIGEETAQDAELTDDPTWIIDPIDGTNNFAAGYNQCAISVGLAIDKEVVLGIVSNPNTGETFHAAKGKGAFLNGKPIKVSKETDIEKSLIGFEISLARSDPIRGKLMKRLEGIAAKARGIRCVGCAALGICYVAAGFWDAYQIDYLYPWDYAGGSIIVEEAGGVVLDTKGGKFNVMNRRLTAAGTQELADQVINIIKTADSS